MKKILTFCFIAMFLLVGCKEPGPGEIIEPTIDYVNVGEVVDSIEILYSDLENIKFSDSYIQEELVRIRNLYDSLNESEKELITNYEHLEELEKMNKSYLEQKEKEEAEKQKIIDAVNKAVELVNQVVPKKTTGENIELPNSYTSEDGIEVYIGWTTNDPNTITNKGLVTQPRKTVKNVVLTAVCRTGDVSQKVEKRVAVGPLGYTMLPDKPVFAYYYSNQRELTQVERETINVINLSFGGISENGDVYVSGLNYQTVLQERKHGIRVCFSVQYKQGFKEWTSTPAKREKLAQSFLDVCQTYHFDGVDIDWEYPEGSAEINGYVEFMKLLYQKLKNANSNYLLTSAMYGGDGPSKYNAGVSHQYMDYVHLMTYDLNASAVAQHLTALGASRNGYSSVEQTIAYYVGAGVPREKLVIGAAFYGKIYELKDNATTFLGERPTIDPYTITYREIRNQYLSKLNQTSGNIKVEKRWDTEAQAAYLCITETSSTGQISKKFITYDDVDSVTLKAQYVFDEGLAGMMFWELGYEDRETDDLVLAIKNVFYK